MNMKANMPVSVVGLGKLGFPLALSFAARGYTVCGYDINPATLAKLKEGISPIIEPRSQELLSVHKGKMVFTDDAEEVIGTSGMTFIVVPTPSSGDGSFSSRYIEEAVSALAPHIKKKRKRHTLIITSTVSPGTMDKVIRPLLETETGKLVGKDIGLCYSPELIALGSVIFNISHPDFIFIGESDPKTGKLVERVRKSICPNRPSAIRTNWINAELIKLALNSYITTKISFANMVARIAERFEGADSDTILQAIGRDSRIGTKYLKGGLGYGGPCFPRDNRSFYATIRQAGLDIDLPLAVDRFNRAQIDYLASLVTKYHRKGRVVGILGLSYKPETDVVEESQGFLLAQKLLAAGFPLLVHDPQSLQAARKVLGKPVCAGSAGDCIRKSDIIVLATPWEEYRTIDWSVYKGKTVIDCWRMVDTVKQSARNRFVQLGK